MKMRRMDRTAVYAVAATRLALEDAGVSIPPEGDDGCGVVLGTWTAGGGSTQVFLDALFRHGPTGAPALLFDSTVANSAASTVGLDNHLRGPNMTISHKEASGLAAVVTAVDILRERGASAMIAGATDAVFETFFKAHDRFEVMSPDASFSSRLAPFDAARSGFVLGESAVSLWLERADGEIEPQQPRRDPRRCRVKRPHRAEWMARSARAVGTDDDARDRGCRPRAVGH